MKTKQLWGHFKKRKRAHEVLLLMKAIRRRYRGVLWIVMDNWSAHWTPAIRRWAKENNVRFQATPTDASWLNRIECQFTPLKKSVLSHVDYEGFAEMRRSLYRFVAWRNRRATKQLSLKRH